MPDLQDPRVAVYLDFDNIVMSWYDRVHGKNSYSRDRQRIAENPADPEIAERLSAATIDVGAIIDFAASFGTLVLTRAYADWSSPVNAIYRSQLVARAVDLVQLFPAAAYAKNGADIRLAVDTVEDMFRLPDLTHVVIVAGDSDYVPLAQRCKRLGRYVVGVGVAGSTAKSLAAACDEFEAYDSLPGVPRVVREPAKAAKPAEKAEKAPVKAPVKATRTTKAKAATGTAAAPAAGGTARSGGRRGTAKAASELVTETDAATPAGAD
ncbi:NYN domain-containing protein, partial [Microbacterium arthrosphaerae]|uniref:NYN domain-containing protein n=1 Tax=Microbacterium arthrosphaerae TaxID=792652 RepID=UPI0035E96260